jgi:hypothetical protein
MANTKFRYSLDDFRKLPDWLQRSWNVFARVSIRADYKRDIATTREAIRAGEALEASEVIRVQRDYALGQNMDKLIRLQLSNPDATDDELLNSISPSIRFINYGVGEVQPSDNPKEEFEANERLNKELINAGEPYFESDKNTKKRITRVTEDSIVDERIYELRTDGVYPKDITPLINTEFGRDLEPFEVNKRLNQMKRRKSRQ